MTQDLDTLLRSSLSNQDYRGHRRELWDAQTGVELSPTKSTAAEIYKGVNSVPSDLRDRVLDQLLRGEIQVQFTNQRGEPTTMNCTLALHLIPDHERERLRSAHTEQVPLTLREVLLEVDPMATLSKQPKKEDPNLIKVWSTDRKGWRAFRLERVTQILVSDDTVSS